MVEFDVTINTKDMYDYNIYHNYRNFNGIFGVLVGIFFLVLSVAGALSDANISYILIMGFAGLYFTIITPIRMYIKSAQQVKLTPAFKKPLHYTVSDSSIEVAQEDMKASIAFTDIYKVADTGKSLIVYVTKARAYIFPKRELGTQEMQLKELFKNGLTPKQCRIK